MDGREIWRTPFHAFASALGYVGEERIPELFFATSDAEIESWTVSGKTLWSRPPGYTVAVMLVNSYDGKASLLANVSGTLNSLNLKDGTLLWQHELTGLPAFADSTITWRTSATSRVY
jgi:hypothetical protein